MTCKIAHPETPKCYVDSDGNVTLNFAPDGARIFNNEKIDWEHMKRYDYQFYATYDPWIAKRKLHND
jgi:hypothetical protein